MGLAHVGVNLHREAAGAPTGSGHWVRAALTVTVTCDASGPARSGGCHGASHGAIMAAEWHGAPPA